MKYLRHFLELGYSQIGANSTGMSDVFGSIDPQVLPATTKFLGDRCLPYGQSFTTGTRDGVGIDDANADTARNDCEVRFGFEWNGLTGSGSGTGASAGARVTGTLASPTGYFGDMRFYGNQIAIVKCVAGVNTDLATAAFSFLANTLYHCVLRVVGTTLSMKAWKNGDPEPAAFTITATDAVVAGVGSMFAGSVKGAGGTAVTSIKLWYISMATGGDVSPVGPKTWAEYLEFLDLQDALRCTLVEVDPLGQTAAGVAATARVVMANLPFISKPEDRYPNICYEEILLEPPKTSRRMTEAFTGRSTMTNGDIVFKNEVINPDLQELSQSYVGRLDAWHNYNWDGRAVRVLYGHPGWRRADFKTVLLGQVQDIARKSRGSSAFKLRGPEGSFKQPVNRSLIGGTGPNANSVVPFALGGFFNAEPPVYDANALSYKIEAGPGIFAGTVPAKTTHDVRDAGGSLTLAQRSISAVNTGTDTLTADAVHGLIVGSTWIGSGSLPAPLTAGIKYYVKTVPSTTTFTLANTSGGATIDITSATTGGTFVGRLYDWSDTGIITLLSTPQGRVTVDFYGTLSVANACLQASILAGVTLPPENFHGQQPAGAVAGWWNAQASLGEVLDQITGSVGTSWNFSREGGFYLHQLDVPSTTATWTLVEDDVRNWRVATRNPPRYAERLGYNKNYAIQRGGDLLGVVTVANRDLYGKPYSLATYFPVESGLDQPANHLLVVNPDERETLLVTSADAQAESQRLYNLRRKVTGTYVFNTGGWALAAELGDSVLLTDPRDGFQNGKNATIVGITDDLAAGGAEVEVFVQIDGQWPVVTSSNPFASEAYY